MGKVLGFLIPFLLEMLFGKKDDKIVLTSKQIWMRRIGSAIIFLSLSLNYIAIGKLYSVTRSYVELKIKYDDVKKIADSDNANRLRIEDLEKSLNFCMKIAYMATPSSKIKSPFSTTFDLSPKPVLSASKAK